jgi:uncharacterized protein YggE
MVKVISAGGGLRTLIALAVGLGLLLLSGCGVETATPAASPNPPARQGGPQTDQASPSARESGLSGADADAAHGTVARGNTGIWVTGRGEATAVPDLAILNLGVETFATTVQQARAEAATAMDRIVGVLKARKVADKDIQTRHFSIAPRYSSRKITRCVDGTRLNPPSGTRLVPPTWDPSPGGRPPEPKGECFEEYQQVILGYQVSNQLTVRLRDLKEIGGIIDAATDAGGDLTRFQGISFTIDDPRGLEAQARAAAIADLQAKAKQFATLTGVKLGRLRFITETGGPAPIIRQLAERGIAAAPAVSTPIQTGELEVVVTVQGVFAIE